MTEQKVEDVTEAEPNKAAEAQQEAQQEAEDISQEMQTESAQGAEFNQLAQDAINQAIQRPNRDSSLTLDRLSMTGPADGIVGAERSELISDVVRPGMTTDAAKDGDQQSNLETQVKELYVDLTNYNIAWKIAQRLQQDTSQLLRGS